MNHKKQPAFLQHRRCLKVALTANEKAPAAVRSHTRKQPYSSSFSRESDAWRTTSKPQPLLKYRSQSRGQGRSAVTMVASGFGTILPPKVKRNDIHPRQARMVTAGYGRAEWMPHPPGGLAAKVASVSIHAVFC